MQKATLVELTVVDKILPLASGYLKSYANADPVVAEGWELELYDQPVGFDAAAIVDELAERKSAVYALSCYVWNMGRMRWLLEELAERVPDASFILGGPQVMHHLERYVAPKDDRVAVCNGEGERTFRHYLRELLEPDPDLRNVPGISFWRDGETVSTKSPERIRDMSEIPSPFTGDIFESGKHNFGVLETNRGCPYNCGFCYWGAATNSRVNRFEEERVRADIDWMSENGFATIFLADANWGISKRDVEFTQYIVDAAKKNGFPLFVAINSAKNNPKRVAEITKVLADGGLLTSQSIALQTTDSDVLEVIGRKNIHLEAYMNLQWALREEGISSFTEMIWPLPGETISSYTAGLTELCRAGADTILVYPHLLLNNTPLYHKREEYELGVRRVPDDASEADVVVSTRWIDEEDCEFGVWVYYLVQCFYNLRGLYFLSNYLDKSGEISFGDLFANAVRAFRSDGDSSIVRFIDQSVRGMKNYFLLNAGEVAHRVLHADRAQFDRILIDFVRKQPYSGRREVAAMFELDLVARPYIYNEAVVCPDYEFSELTVDRVSSDGIEITLSETAARVLRELELKIDVGESGRLRISHPVRQKMPFIESRGMEENIAYCQAMTLHMREILPTWQALGTMDSGSASTGDRVGTPS